MKIVKVEDLHCDAGWRVNSFLKLTTDEGIVGWSEYNESFGSPGLAGVIDAMMPSVFSALLSSCPSNSSIDTPAPIPDMPKCTGNVFTLWFHTGIAVAPISTPV